MIAANYSEFGSFSDLHFDYYMRSRSRHEKLETKKEDIFVFSDY
jgi:hypothetical protein